ncbi:MAG TPA: AsmA family protein [Syntrophorhabdales bacterium]|nr:AsmA family protein [Syntrophorhabdales bacterium]
MRAKRKKSLMIAGGVVVLIVIAALVAVLLFDINSYKSKIETAASGATGLDVRIKGRMGLSFFPFGVSAKDIHVANKGAEILSLERLKLRVELMSLLKKQLNVTGCELVRPAVAIVKDAEGKYNFESTQKISTEGWLGTASGLHELKLSKGALVYLDKKTGVKTELKEINLAIGDLSVGDTSGDIIKNVSFTGSFDCKELLQKDLRIENLKAPVKADKGVFSLKPLTMDVFDAKGEGDLTADESASDIAYKLNVKVSNLDFEKLEEFFGTKKVIGGKGELSASLTVKEKGGRILMSNLDGTFALRGDDLVTYTMDLDKVLTKYETSQKFHLADVVAFFFVGPLGTVALKGYRYGDFYYQAQGGQGAITQFISHWKIQNGEAEAADCALATHHNRVALIGKLNLVSERFDHVTVALLDDKGCPTFKQTINGSFDSPRAGTVTGVESLAGPFFDLYRKAKRFAQAGKCEVFYNGAVQQPR